jgi:excisionase family DNA binding protein
MDPVQKHDGAKAQVGPGHQQSRVAFVQDAPLEVDRGNSIRTWNGRLSALRAFFRFVTMSEPALALRVSEAAKSIGISASLMYQLIREGKVKAVRPSDGRTIIPMDELKRYLASLVA